MTKIEKKNKPKTSAAKKESKLLLVPITKSKDALKGGNNIDKGSRMY